MNDQQLLRYSRHILLDEIGIEGQVRLRAARIVLVGMGGLGCPAALYLASAGIGSFALMDPDTVELTNLQRQILYCTDDIGTPKVTAAARHLAALNPDVGIHALQTRADAAVLDEVVPQAAVVLDCSDNFATRHAVNRACVRHRVPLVSGAALRFSGQVAVFDTRLPDAPCYHCLFAEDEAHEDTVCATMGVFAPLVGIVGATQAAEALKLACGAGETLAGRLSMLDALSMRWESLRIARDSACPVCARRDR